MTNGMPGNEVEEPMEELVILANDQEGKTQKRMQVFSLRTGSGCEIHSEVDKEEKG